MITTRGPGIALLTASMASWLVAAAYGFESGRQDTRTPNIGSHTVWHADWGPVNTPTDPNGSESTNGANGVFDPDARSPLSFQITPQLSIGGKINLELKTRDNQDVDDGSSDRQTLFEPQISVAGLFQPVRGVEIYGEGKLTYTDPIEDETGKKSHDTEFELRRGYLHLLDLAATPISLQVGRARFKDEREWVYDENLDAVRLMLEKDPLTVELSVSSIWIDPERDERDIVNYTLFATYEYDRQEKIALYALARDDRSRKDRDPVFLGLSWHGRPHKRQRAWLDAAMVIGHDRRKDLEGFGVDVGWTGVFKHPLKPSLTLSYAYGSGDSDPKDGKDRSFQQTDLQDNSGKFNGITKFSYYGEVFDPELSNMMIFTVGVGIAPSKKLSLDLVYHYYALVELSDELRDTSLDEDLTGDDRDLGHEIDLIVGLKLDEHTRASLTAGAFMPGAAFPENDTAYAVNVKIQISF